MPLFAEPPDVLAWWIYNGQVDVSVRTSDGTRQTVRLTHETAQELLETLGRLWAKRFGPLVVKEEA